MLNFFRKSSESLLIKLLMLLLLSTFVLWGVSGMIGSNKNQDYAFKVGEKEFSVLAWNSIIKNYTNNLKTQNGAVDTNTLNQMKSKILDVLIKRSILLQEAQRLNLLVSDTMVQYSIASKPEFLNSSNKFDQKKFQEYLKEINSTEELYVANLKENIAINLLLQPLNNINVVAKPIINYISSLRSLVRNIDLIEIDYSKFLLSQTPSDQEIHDTLNNNQKQFSTPEIREVKYFSFSTKDVDQTLNASEEELKLYYNTKLFMFTEGEKRKIFHLLFTTLNEAINARKELLNEMDIKATAVKYNAKNSQTNLGFLGKEAFDDNFRDAIFNLKIDGITEPLHSPLGYHLFKVTEITPSKTRSFEDAKQMIVKQLSDEKIFNEISELSQSINIDIIADVGIEDIAKKHNFVLSKSVTSSDINIKDDQIINSEIFKTTPSTTDINNLSAVTQLNDHTFFVLKVEKITPSKLMDLNQVRDKVIALWKKNQSLAKIKEMSLNIIQDLKDNKLLTDKFLIQTKINLSHHNFSQFDSKLLNELATLKVGDVTPLINVDSKYYIAKLTGVSVDKKDAHKYNNEITRHYQDVSPELLVDQYINVVSKSYPVKINAKVIN